MLDPLALPEQEDLVFTPEAFPGVSPEVCAFLNTPVEECDPDMVRLLLAAVAVQILPDLPPELGLDVEGLAANLWDRLGVPPDGTYPDAEPPEAPAAPEDTAPVAPSAAENTAPVTPAVAEDTVPIMPPAAEDTAPVTQSTAEDTAPVTPPTTENAVADQPDAPPIPAPATQPADGVPQPAPNAGIPIGPAFRRSRPPSDGGKGLRRRRSRLDRRRSREHRSLHDGPQRPPPARLCHAIRAGPP